MVRQILADHSIILAAVVAAIAVAAAAAVAVVVAVAEQWLKMIRNSWVLQYKEKRCH